MPEGDTLHRAARSIQVLVGERVEVETPHPRAQAEQIAGRLDGRVLESVEAVGKNLLLRFEGGIVLRSHLRMSGRWTVRARGEHGTGRPWLIIRGARAEGVLWNGPVLELHTRALARLGPDILGSPPAIDVMLSRMAAVDESRRLGEVLQDQSVVAGIGNMWMAEALWEAKLSPWRRLAGTDNSRRRLALDTAARLMRSALDDGRGRGKNVHNRAGRPCPRCGTPIRARGLGDDNRTAFWCPSCQPDEV
jgi:endonuclease VIII